MTVENYIKRLQENPKSNTFQDTIAVIDAYYTFTPTAFTNGEQHNQANENNGSCKIFAFAKMNNLSQEETLACFGNYYFEEVLLHPEAHNHSNIRNFIRYGWEGIQFENEALSAKK
ncbi:HopJ type III effector protein [Flavobacterium sp.]|uniref:HopJ type III effector protein n=1 Tax=Flavobacterium sp. TaxID=239 RepID=UPI00261E09AE|nr:HopJ type III effector protein [Flavobacterium sp.]MDD3005401.1 HopJ type III effector protein [Flavobacterium sp.]